MTTELEPFVLYRLVGAQVECALWQMAEGPMALALFLSGDNANAYRDATSLGSDWQVYQPARDALWQLLRAYHDAGISYAVLDPDLQRAKRIFPIAEILSSAPS